MVPEISVHVGGLHCFWAWWAEGQSDADLIMAWGAGRQREREKGGPGTRLTLLAHSLHTK